MYSGAFRDISYNWGRGCISSVPAVFKRVLEKCICIKKIYIYQSVSGHVPEF